MAIQKYMKNQKHGLLHCVRNDAISTCSDGPKAWFDRPVLSLSKGSSRTDGPMPVRPNDMHRPDDHNCFAESCPLALIGTAWYPALVHRPAASLHAPHGRSHFRCCASLRSPWSTYERAFTSKRAPVSGAHKKGRLAAAQIVAWFGVPTGIRTPVASVKGTCPRPLDDGDADDATAIRVRGNPDRGFPADLEVAEAGSCRHAWTSNLREPLK